MQRKPKNCIIKAEDRSEANRLFDLDIVPLLEHFVTERDKALRSRSMRYLIGAILLLTITLLGSIVARISGVSLWLPITLGVMGLIPLVAVAETPMASARDTIMETFMAAICRYHGNVSFTRRGAEDFALSMFTDARLVLQPDSTHLEDLIVGEHKGVRYEMVDASLTRGSFGSRTSSQHERMLFHARGLPRIAGQLNLHDQSDKVQLLIDRIAVGKWKGVRIKGIDARLEGKYAIYSSSTDDAALFLTPGVAQKLLMLPEVIGTDYMNAAFFEDRVLIAVDPPRGGLFRDRGLYREMTSPKCSEDQLREQFLILFRQCRLGMNILDVLLSNDAES